MVDFTNHWSIFVIFLDFIFTVEKDRLLKKELKYCSRERSVQLQPSSKQT